MRGKIQIATKHRKDTFKEVIDYVKSMKEPVDAMIEGDYNQEIESNEVKQFFAQLQLQDVHQNFNEIELSQMDHTHNRGTKCIDSIDVTPDLIKHVKGSRLFEKNEIVNTDHRHYVIDINLEECFQDEFSGWDKIERVILDPNKRTDRGKFNEFVDETLGFFPLESTVQNVNISIVTHKNLE